jgi:hypothetical protein
MPTTKYYVLWGEGHVEGRGKRQKLLPTILLIAAHY